MNRRLVNVLIGIGIGIGAVAPLAACGSPTTPSSTPAAPASSASSPVSTVSVAATGSPASGSAVCGPADAVARRMGMKDIAVYTASTDPNHLLGRQGEYTSKVEWTTDGEDSGIEAFADAADAQLRYVYLRAFRPPIGDGYDYSLPGSHLAARVDLHARAGGSAEGVLRALLQGTNMTRPCDHSVGGAGVA